MTPDLRSRSLALEALTERQGLPMPAQQISMAKTRYQFAATYAQGVRVLEVACGAGFGSELLSGTARFLVAGDLAEGNLAMTKAHVGGLPLVRFDAHDLPFKDNSFDVVVAFECIYYFSSPHAVATECWRLLEQGGCILVATANPRRRGFHESPHSVMYFDADGLKSLLSDAGFDVQVFGAFPEETKGVRVRALLAATSLARRFHLVPRNLRWRAVAKRVLSGRLERFEGIGETDIPIAELHPIGGDPPATSYKVLYAQATKAKNPWHRARRDSPTPDSSVPT